MRSLFITGTDTNVGKTAVTALTLAHSLHHGARVRALKPFCSGTRTDALLLWELQNRTLALDTVNPFYFAEPLAPATAAQRNGKSISLQQTLEQIRSHADACDLLLIEGAGGLLAPLGESFNAADLIQKLEAETVVVAANRIGVLNHTLLTLEALATRGIRAVKVVLVESGPRDESSVTNEADLRQLLGSTPLHSIPRLENYRPEADFIRGAARDLYTSLAPLTAFLN